MVRVPSDKPKTLTLESFRAETERYRLVLGVAQRLAEQLDPERGDRLRTHLHLALTSVTPGGITAILGELERLLA
jgi:hypothetical protein